VELVIEPALKPFYQSRYRATHEAIVMEDGAPAHKSKLASAARNKYNIQKMPWPAQSPDLNPIENLWRIMKSRINKREPRVTTHEALSKALQEEWDRFIAEDFRKLIESMPKRVKMCLKNRGGSIPY
jgi:transposase